jgi:hypothetical protein
MYNTSSGQTCNFQKSKSNRKNPKKIPLEKKEKKKNSKIENLPKPPEF